MVGAAALEAHGPRRGRPSFALQGEEPSVGLRSGTLLRSPCLAMRGRGVEERGRPKLADGGRSRTNHNKF